MSQETRFVVVKHSSGSGYVVRTAYVREDGSLWVPKPYTDAHIEYQSSQEWRARQTADKINYGYSNIYA